MFQINNQTLISVKNNQSKQKNRLSNDTNQPKMWNHELLISHILEQLSSTSLATSGGGGSSLKRTKLALDLINHSEPTSAGDMAPKIITDCEDDTLGFKQ